MKNKMLIGTITVFIGIACSIAMLNITAPTKETYYFDRKFSNDTILKFEKVYEKLEKNNHYGYYYCPNNIIAEIKESKNEKNKIKYCFNFIDYLFINKKKNEIELPTKSNILLVDIDYIIYRNKLKYYKFEFRNKSTSEINLKNIDICSLISINECPNKYLCFGELYKNNLYTSGFFKFDIKTYKIEIIKDVKKDLKTSIDEIFLKHFGYFQNFENNEIAYSSGCSSKIFLFKKQGIFNKVIVTKDQAPPSKVLKDTGNNIVYSKDGYTNTNAGLFMDNKSIYIFSMVSKIKDQIVIDQYSKSTLKYIKSFKLNYNNYNSGNVSKVFIKKNRVILQFEFCYASFIFSRHI
jgi:hypothetical protein